MHARLQALLFNNAVNSWPDRQALGSGSPVERGCCDIVGAGGFRYIGKCLRHLRDAFSVQLILQAQQNFSQYQAVDANTFVVLYRLVQAVYLV